MPLMDLGALTRETVTHVVSLGAKCAVAFNIRRHWNFGGAFPFDWWITPVEGVVGLLNRPDPAWLYDPDELEPVRNGGDWSVQHRSLGILRHHEFPRRWKEPYLPIADNWRDHIASAQTRTEYLLRKLMSLNAPGHRVLFIRHGLRAGESREAVAAALDRSFPAAAFALAAVDVPHALAHGWKGDPCAWDGVLSTFGVSLRSDLHRPFDPATAAPEHESRALSSEAVA
jgi:hypothetical protein